MTAKVETQEVVVRANKSLELSAYVPIVAGSVSVDQVHFTFEEPEDWQDLTLSVYFANSASKITEGVTDWNGSSNVSIPSSVIQDPGYVEVAVIGTTVDNTDPENPVIIQRAITQACPNLLRVYPSGVVSVS